MIKKVLIIGFVWPEPTSSAAGTRMLQIITLLKTYGFEIIFVSAAAKTKNTFDLNDIGVTNFNIRLNHYSFDTLIKEISPNIVVFDRYLTEEQYGWRVAEHCPEALRVLDTEDLHFLRKGREQAYKDGVDFTDTYLYNEIAKRELASIFRCDLSLIISEVEMRLLKEKFKVDEGKLFYLPFLLSFISKDKIKNLPSFEERAHFMTIGTFLHEPNYQSVLNLKKNIWPLIRKKLPKAELHIYGAHISAKVEQLHKVNEGFLVRGFAEDASKTMQKYKICLAPLPFGAGLKGKLFDAMENGTPCVMSSVAAEGVFGTMKPNGFVTDNSKKFADQSVEMYCNKGLWQQYQNNGFSTINLRFQKESFETVLLERLQSIFKNLKQHRQNHFLGEILQHHTLKATKYLSKWIEEKNK